MGQQINVGNVPLFSVLEVSFCSFICAKCEFYKNGCIVPIEGKSIGAIILN